MAGHVFHSPVLPWFSVDAAADEIWIIAHLPVAERNEVERCMGCPYEQCMDCMGINAKQRITPYGSGCGRPGCDIEKIRKMIEEGKSNREICKELRCSQRTANRYRARFTTEGARKNNF